MGQLRRDHVNADIMAPQGLRPLGSVRETYGTLLAAHVFGLVPVEQLRARQVLRPTAAPRSLYERTLFVVLDVALDDGGLVAERIVNEGDDWPLLVRACDDDLLEEWAIDRRYDYDFARAATPDRPLHSHPHRQRRQRRPFRTLMPTTSAVAAGRSRETAILPVAGRLAVRPHHRSLGVMIDLHELAETVMDEATFVAFVTALAADREAEVEASGCPPIGPLGSRQHRSSPLLGRGLGCAFGMANQK